MLVIARVITGRDNQEGVDHTDKSVTTWNRYTSKDIQESAYNLSSWNRYTIYYTPNTFPRFTRELVLGYHIFFNLSRKKC
jgi:hypothetical protein